MLSKKLLTALKKGAGKKSVSPLTDTFHIVEKEGEKWIFTTDSVKLFAVKLPEDYQLITGAYYIDDIVLLEKYSANNDTLKPLETTDSNYTTSPDFWKIIPSTDNEQSHMSDMRFNSKYFTEMIDFISVAESHKIPEINNIRIYKGKPATYQTDTIVALLMPMRA